MAATHFFPGELTRVFPRCCIPCFNPDEHIKLIIVQLNRSVLEKEVFSELAQKYFRGSSGQEYNVKVLIANDGKEQVLFSSGKQADNMDSSAPDGSLNLFGPPFRHQNQGMSGPMGPGIFGMPGMGMPGGRPQFGDNHGATSERLVRFEPFPPSPDQAGLQLVVKHQSGSLEAAVSSLRNRNLIVSFSVLVLLGVTMTLIVVGAQRARRLARMQMDFVTGVSHEVRTPLAAITSAAENISHGVITDPQQVVRYGNSILRQSRQLTTLMEQVLLFATTQQK